MTKSTQFFKFLIYCCDKGSHQVAGPDFYSSLVWGNHELACDRKRRLSAWGSIVPPISLSAAQHFCFNCEWMISLHSQPLVLCSLEQARLGPSMCPAQATKSQGIVCSFISYLRALLPRTSYPGSWGKCRFWFSLSGTEIRVPASKELPEAISVPELHIQKPGSKTQGIWRAWNKVYISAKRSQSTSYFQALYLEIIVSFVLLLFSFVSFERGSHLSPTEPGTCGMTKDGPELLICLPPSS